MFAVSKRSADGAAVLPDFDSNKGVSTGTVSFVIALQYRCSAGASNLFSAAGHIYTHGFCTGQTLLKKI